MRGIELRIELKHRKRGRRKGDRRLVCLFFFFKDTATTEIYTLSLHDALPIWLSKRLPVRYHILVCRILGVKITRKGAENLDAAHLIVSNHVSWLDIPVMSAVAPVSFIAKKEVADWALFGLGTQIDTNTPAVREALFRGLNEEDDEARGEALVGLARCGDERVVAALLDEWAEPPIGSLSLEAAAAIGDRRLLPGLYRQREIWLGKGDVEEPFRTLLSDAIAACEPG